MNPGAPLSGPIHRNGPDNFRPLPPEGTGALSVHWERLHDENERYQWRSRRDVPHRAWPLASLARGLAARVLPPEPDEPLP